MSPVPRLPKLRASARRRGFTLIEVLVAVLIMVIAFTLVWTTFSTTLQAWERGTKVLDGLHQGDWVLDQLVSALRSAVWFKSSQTRYGLHFEDREGDEEPADVLSWVTSASAFLPPGSPLLHGLHRLEVTVEKNPDGPGQALAVRAWPYLADDEDAEQAEPWYIPTPVVGLDCQFYNAEQEAWEDAWENTNAVPPLVQVTLFVETGEGTGKPMQLARAVEIPVGVSGTNTAASASGGVAPSADGSLGGGTGGGLDSASVRRSMRRNSSNEPQNVPPGVAENTGRRGRGGRGSRDAVKGGEGGSSRPSGVRFNAAADRRAGAGGVPSELPRPAPKGASGR